MTTILIVGLPSSYTHFLETLQVTGKLDKITFDELSEMLSQHNKNFGKKKQVGEDVFLQRPAQVNLQLIVLEAEKEDILYKVMVEAKVEKKNFNSEETIKAEGIFKAKEIVKEKGIFKEEEIVKAEAIFKAIFNVEEKLQKKVKTKAEDRIQVEEEI